MTIILMPREHSHAARNSSREIVRNGKISLQGLTHVSRREIDANMAETHIHPLRKFRKENNLTLADLSELSQVSEQSISRIERGEQNPSISAIKRLAKATGYVVTAHDILQALLDANHEDSALESDGGI